MFVCFVVSKTMNALKNVIVIAMSVINEIAMSKIIGVRLLNKNNFIIQHRTGSKRVDYENSGRSYNSVWI